MMRFKTSPVRLEGLENLYPFDSHYMDMDGLKIHYTDEGKGEPVVMVHGNPTWSFYFRNLILGLREDCRAIAPDHMGCGLSDKPSLAEYDFRLKSRIDDLDTLISRLNLDRKITLVMHDWGGMIGTAFALRKPERIGRIVVLNTAAFFPPGGKSIPLRLKLIRNMPWFAVPAVQGLNLFALAALFMAPYKKLPPEIKKGLLAPYKSWRNRTAVLKFVQDIPLYETDPSYAIVASVDRELHRLDHIPMLILWGEKDFVFHRDYFQEWKKRFPTATAKIYPDAGHYLVEDIPDRILTEIKTFIAKNPI